MTVPMAATEAASRPDASGLRDLDFADATDKRNADRGLIAEARGQVLAPDGHVAWDIDRWS